MKSAMKVVYTVFLVVVSVAVVAEASSTPPASKPSPSASKPSPSASKPSPSASKPSPSATASTPLRKSPSPPPLVSKLLPPSPRPPVPPSPKPKPQIRSPSPAPSPSPANYAGAKLHKRKHAGGVAPGNSSAPLAWNWILRGVVPPVVQQGVSCGSCWANAAVAATVAALAISTNTKPVWYSRQIVVDCANDIIVTGQFFYDSGCNDGDPADAMVFMSQYSIPTEAAYPYTSNVTETQGVCNVTAMNLATFAPTDPSWLRGGGPVYYQTYSESGLWQAVAVQPIVIYWNMGGNWATWGTGTYELANQNDPVNGCVNFPNSADHVMLVVGYNAANTTITVNGNSVAVRGRWLIQNSFGTTWGASGLVFVRMTGDIYGPCGMYSYLPAPSFNFARLPTNLKSLPASTVSGGSTTSG